MWRRGSALRGPGDGCTSLGWVLQTQRRSSLTTTLRVSDHSHPLTDLCRPKNRDQKTKRREMTRPAPRARPREGRPRGAPPWKWALPLLLALAVGCPARGAAHRGGYGRRASPPPPPTSTSAARPRRGVKTGLEEGSLPRWKSHRRRPAASPHTVQTNPTPLPLPPPGGIAGRARGAGHASLPPPSASAPVRGAALTPPLNTQWRGRAGTRRSSTPATSCGSR